MFEIKACENFNHRNTLRYFEDQNLSARCLDTPSFGWVPGLSITTISGKIAMDGHSYKITIPYRDSGQPLQSFP
ncbi:MAG: hypothetical protein DRN37_04040 [Thermoplasmata archaeon]|nr:MAG: hypothetical protein DRN37_04040 [Thermoplasmata archaeon]